MKFICRQIKKSCRFYTFMDINGHPIFILLFILNSFFTVYAQENKKDETNKKPVKKIFEGSRLINFETIESLQKKGLQFIIQHRFGRMDEGFEKGKNFDLFGILGVANIRLGINYGITDKLTIGLGATKYNYLYDLQWKYLILQQTQGNGSPISASYFGNTSIATFSNESLEIVNRVSYYHQLLIARKINKRLSLQIAPTFTYFNLIDTTGGNRVKHSNFGIGFGGRQNVSPQGSIIFEYNQPITVSDYGSLGKTKASMGIGYEIATRGHAFQFFITNGNFIINQYDMISNTNDVTKGEFFIGFNITRNWNLKSG